MTKYPLEEEIKKNQKVLQLFFKKDLFDSEMVSIRNTLTKVEELIEENKIGTYWTLEIFSALDIHLAVVLIHLRYNKANFFQAIYVYFSRNSGYQSLYDDKPNILLFLEDILDKDNFKELAMIESFEEKNVHFNEVGSSKDDHDEHDHNEHDSIKKQRRTRDEKIWYNLW